MNIQEIPIFLIDEKETVGIWKGSEYDFQFYKQPTRYVVRTLVDTVITMLWSFYRNKTDLLNIEDRLRDPTSGHQPGQS